jgi:hypothetical protein
MWSRTRNEAIVDDPKRTGVSRHRERRFHYHPAALGHGIFSCDESTPAAPQFAIIPIDETPSEPAKPADNSRFWPATRKAEPNRVEKLLIAEHGVLHRSGESGACPKCGEERPEVTFPERSDTGTLIVMVLVLLVSLCVGVVYLAETSYSQYAGPFEIEGGYAKPPGFANH